MSNSPMSIPDTVDARTTHYDLPLPYSTNRLEVDVLRLMEILDQLTILLYESRVLSNTDLTERRALIDGWMGLGSKPLILTNEDNLNDLQPWQATYFASLPINGPEPDFIGWIKTECRPNQDIFVEATSLTGGKYFRARLNNVWSDWGVVFTSTTHINLGANVNSALQALGLETVNQRLSDLERASGDGAILPVNRAGNLNTGTIFDLDVQQHTDTLLTCTGTGTAATIRFNNLPDTTNGTFVWYLELVRGGTRLPNFTSSGKTFSWQGGATPTLSTSTTGWDQIMFEYRLGRSKIEMMLIKSGTL